MCGFLDAECGQDIGLTLMNIGDALDGGAVVDAHAVALDATQIGQGGFGRQIAARTLEALAHDAVQDQRHEANTGVRLDALGQPVIHRGDLDRFLVVSCGTCQRESIVVESGGALC